MKYNDSKKLVFLCNVLKFLFVFGVGVGALFMGFFLLFYVAVLIGGIMLSLWISYVKKFAKVINTLKAKG